MSTNVWTRTQLSEYWFLYATSIDLKENKLQLKSRLSALVDEQKYCDNYSHFPPIFRGSNIIGPTDIIIDVLIHCQESLTVGSC